MFEPQLKLGLQLCKEHVLTFLDFLEYSVYDNQLSLQITIMKLKAINKLLTANQKIVLLHIRIHMNGIDQTVFSV